jgi:hypothetical protein
MATLTIPNTFIPGTPALASEVNANFQAIVSWTQSNIGTDNLGILSARSVALPSSPQYAILSINQTASQPALRVANNGSDTAVTVTQGGLLAAGKSLFLLSDSINQVAVGSAHMRMTLSGTTSIPAIVIEHGAIETFKVSRTAASIVPNLSLSGTFTVSNTTTLNNTLQVNAVSNLTGQVNLSNDIISSTTYHVGPKRSDKGNQSATYTLDLSTGTVHRISLNASGALALTLTNPTVGGAYIIELYHNVSSSTVTWPVTVKWPSATTPTLSTASAKTDLVSLIWTGSVYYGNVALGY